ncbi:MAG: hypothetical protein P4L03_05135 [Terracidiphilus sp.]|nr:hypothetical protein [Terracidiphilus sp.]
MADSPQPAALLPDTLDPDRCWELLQRVAASTSLRRATRLQELLLFVGQCALRDNRAHVSEQEIGARIFGRPADYDTSVDNIVRTNMSDLRKRIAAYFEHEGTADPIHMEIPRGSYLPVFTLRPEIAAATPQPAPAESVNPAGNKLWKWWALTASALLLAALVLSAGLLARRWFVPTSPVDAFWTPVLHNKSDILICAGGNTFLQNPVPGFFTAGKEIDYPYFSLQTEVSTTLLSALIERHGATPQFRFAASTPLPELHENPIILLNAYNNQWTLRLTENLRYRFSPMGFRPQSIVNQQHPNISWHRDTELPYENSPDYALLARFWDRSTDNWVVVLAGLGRNGTEAATRFATDPHYMQELRDRLGKDFANRNIEVVLKVAVVDGKTGVPEIMAVYAW